MTDEDRKVKAGALALCAFHCPQVWHGGNCDLLCAGANDDYIYAAAIFRRYEQMARAVLKAAQEIG